MVKIKRKILFVLLIILVVTSPINAQKLKDTKFVGNYHVPNKLLEKEVKNLKVNENYTEELIKKDVQNIFNTGFFYEVNAEVRNDVVIFRVKQNPILSKFNIKGNTLVENEELFKEIITSKDRIYNEKRLRRDVLKIYKYYEEKGYLGTQVKNILYQKDKKLSTRKAERGFLEIILQEGLIKSITIKGLEDTNEEIIDPMIKIKKGDFLRKEKAEETIKEIYETNFFKKVDIDTKLSEDKKGIDVILRVEEAKTGSYEVGLGYNEKKGSMLIGNIKEKNLFGTGKAVGLNSDINELGYQISGFYSDPYLNENYELDIKFDFGEEDEEEHDVDYNTEYQRLSTILTRKTDMGNYFGGFKLENYESELKRSDHGRLVALNGGYYIDNTKNLLNPSEGQYINLNIEIADEAFGSEENYNKFSGKYYQYFNGFKEDHAIATRLELGFGSEEMPYFKEHIASNSHRLKSYDYGDLRGNRLLLGSVEYRIPIWKDKMFILGGVSFGDAWRTEERDKDIKSELIIGTKFKLMGMGNIRVDYALNEDDDKFQISFQNKF